jgi:hypothetical protein
LRDKAEAVLTIYKDMYRSRNEVCSKLRSESGSSRNNSKARAWRSVNFGYGNIIGENIINAPALFLHPEPNITNRFLLMFLQHYILSPEQLLQLGYSVESPAYPGHAIIYKDPAVFALPTEHNFLRLKCQC